eukprot:CAMPEP_0184698292 /NCGR_PEP_ID=MMETSP0313-20130426/4968_1 /TAXON_ID=2792 /ORGANISM="Porphyridium aerugineum, Strain SAG 1380-2" /LENGTH=147 /DNA_ID=CAMNT_0027157211 /DNA_START=330 /DNA_END=773 /DNA_ORIENTATION=+
MDSTTASVQKSDEEWKKILTKEEYRVLRQNGTERAFTGEYDKHFPVAGYFKCRACGNPLYSAQAKFDSGCGWPAFDKHFVDSIHAERDTSHGMQRTAINCKRCMSHLGHVFEGEHLTDTNVRHCVNSVSIQYDAGPVPQGMQERKEF